MIAIFSFVCVLIAGLGSDERLGQILLRGFIVSLVCGGTGYLCGMVVKVLFRELPEPQSEDFLRLHGEFTKTLKGLPEEVTQAFYDSLSGDSKEGDEESAQQKGTESEDENTVNDQEHESQEKEKAMVSDST
jgi:hypothetical protein